MYKEFFEMNGADVHVEADGPSALRALEEGPYDIVLLDRILDEGMDGFDVLREMRNSDKTKNTPVIFLTNLNLEESEKGFIQSHNVSGYYVKAEVSLDTLAQVVASI